MKTAAKIFLIITCVVLGLSAFASVFSLIPLLWAIPMTVHYFKNDGDVGTGFKVCTLLFANLIAGILMLCDNA